MSLDQPTPNVKRQTTADAFLGGRLTIAQPASGFRAGLDSVLLGAAVSASEGALLDLGAGVGTAALVALADRPRLTATLVESDADIGALARANLNANGFAGRGNVVTLDVASAGRARAAAGLSADHYSAVIANPPFFEAGNGTAASVERRAAREASAEALDLWVKAAASHAAPDGEIIFIHVAERLPALLASFTARFGAVTALPLAPRDGEAATRVLVRGIKGSRAPFALLATRAMHEPAGRAFQPEFEAIFRGAGRLHW